MRVLCLVDWPARGRWAWDAISENNDQVTVFSVPHPTDTSALFRLPYYARYLSWGWRSLPNLDQFDVIVAWEAKNGFALALKRALLNQHTPPLVILTFSIKGWMKSLVPLVRFAMKGVGCITCVAEGESEYYRRLLALPQNKTRTLPMATPPLASPIFLDAEYAQRPFIFASGRSYRDYATLAKAMQDLNVQLVINARPFNLRGVTLPSHTQINDLMPQPQFHTLLQRALFVVVPLQPVPHASGETHLVQIMAARKAVIVTETTTTREYVEHMQTGLLVPPKDPRAMREAICYLLDNPIEARRMGDNAFRRWQERYTWSGFAENLVRILNDVVDGSKNIEPAPNGG